MGGGIPLNDPHAPLTHIGLYLLTRDIDPKQ